MKKEQKRKCCGADMSTRSNEINTDPQGSWTGAPDDPFDKPIQDADDL